MQYSVDFYILKKNPSDLTIISSKKLLINM